MLGPSMVIGRRPSGTKLSRLSNRNDSRSSSAQMLLHEGFMLMGSTVSCTLIRPRMRRPTSTALVERDELAQLGR